MPNEDQPVQLYHKVLGDCILERTEGVNWVVRREGETTLYRIPPTRRAEFKRRSPHGQHEGASSPSAQDAESRTVSRRAAAEQIGVPAVVQPASAKTVRIPSKPEEIRLTVPELWWELEGWIKQREELDNNHLSFCRRVLQACFAGRLLSDGVAYDAGRLLRYALKRGFRSKYLSIVQLHDATRGSESDTPRSAAYWIAMAAWGKQTHHLDVAEYEFCELLAQSMGLSTGIADRFKVTAGIILAKATERGFSHAVAPIGVPGRDEARRVEDTNGHADESGLDRKDGNESALGISFASARENVSLEQADPRLLRRVIQSTRTGLPPRDGWGRSLTVGFERLEQRSHKFFTQVDQRGAGLIVRGAYGQGKTFSLNLLADLALEAGFAVAQAEVDASENRLDRPDQIYRGLMANLRLPGTEGVGAELLAAKVARKVSDMQRAKCLDPDVITWRKEWLYEHVDCHPIAWLFADPECLNKRYLMSLFAGDKSVTASQARRSHVWGGGIKDWPTFSYGTQGDVGSYMLAGVGRLCRLLDMKGLILVFDEMEKWQDLDWKAQSRAGNLLGGLIWGATAPCDQRACRQRVENPNWGGSHWNGCDHPNCLQHSGFGGGSQFTTLQPCSLGVAIAMTPRGEQPPEDDWRQYGSLECYDLPEFDLSSVREYLQKITPVYQRAYGLQQPIAEEVMHWAYGQWRDRGDRSARSGVAAVVESLDRWRDTIQTD